MAISRDTPLRLYEELLLLSLDDEKGTPVFGVPTGIALGGALLAELLMERRVGLDGKGSKARLALLDATPLGDPLLDECLQRVVDAKRAVTLPTWVSRFSQTRRLRRRAAERLVQRRILRQEEGRVLLLFPRTSYPARDPRPERRLVGRVKAAILRPSRVDARTIVLISLADKTGLLRQVFRTREERAELKRRKQRIASIVAGEAAGRATGQAVETMNAAIVAATVMPAVVTTTVATHS